MSCELQSTIIGMVNDTREKTAE